MTSISKQRSSSFLGFIAIICGCFLVIIYIPHRTTKKEPQLHQCNAGPVPHIAGVLESAQLLALTNKSFVRFGDADIDLMMGIGKVWQRASTELAMALLSVLRVEDKELFIGLPDTFSGCSEHHRDVVTFYHQHDVYRQFLMKEVKLDRQYLQTWLTTPYVYNAHSACLLLSDIYRTLRTIWRDKHIVLLRGDNKQVYNHDIYDTARSQTVIYAPRYQAYDAYAVLREQLMNQDPDALYILTAGPVSKLLILDLVKVGRRALDLGHLAKDYNLYCDNLPVGDFWVD